MLSLSSAIVVYYYYFSLNLPHRSTIRLYTCRKLCVGCIGVPGSALFNNSSRHSFHSCNFFASCLCTCSGLCVSVVFDGLYRGRVPSSSKARTTLHSAGDCEREYESSAFKLNSCISTKPMKASKLRRRSAASLGGVGYFETLGSLA